MRPSLDASPSPADPTLRQPASRALRREHRLVQVMRTRGAGLVAEYDPE